MSSVAPYSPKPQPIAGTFAALWLCAWVWAALWATGFQGGLSAYASVDQAVSALSDQGIQPEVSPSARPVHQTSTSPAAQPRGTAALPSTCGASPLNGNPAEESEIKSGKECAGWSCYAARRGLPDPQQAGHHGREPGKDKETLPLYDMHCSWRAFLALA
jgi:hypothetical protein